MMRTLRHLFGRAVMGAAFLLGLAQPQMALAWTPDPDEALLLDVRLGKYQLGEGVRGYQTPSGPCVDMADTIMALDLAIRLDKKLRRATGWAFEERHTLTIDREANIVQIMNKSSRLESDDIVDTPEGWCVNAAKLGQWLGVKLTADTSSAILFLKSDTKLPVEMALERKDRAASARPSETFDLRSMKQANVPFGGMRMPSVDAVVSLGGLRQKGSSQHFTARYELYAAGELGPVAYDARLSSTNKGIPQSLRLRAYRTDPNGELLGPLKATHFELGDVSGTSSPLVSQSTAGRGAMITNRPIERPDSFARTDFRGELPNGWDAELYRNGQLLAVMTNRADGRYEFLDVPLLYGQNRFEIVLYGPQGQIKREDRVVPVGADSIPPRQTWYWAGVNQIGHDLIGLSGGARLFNEGWRGTVGIERGLNTKTSVSAYGHSLILLDGVRRNYLEAALRRSIGPTLTEFSFSSDLTGGMAARGQLLAGFGSTFISAEAMKAWGGFQSDRALRNVTGDYHVAVDQTVKLGRFTLPLHAESRYVTRNTGNDSLDTAFRTSANFGRIILTGELAWRHNSSSQGPPPPDQLEASLIANARIGRIRLRGEGRFRLKPDARFDSLAIVAEWNARKREDNGRGGAAWRAEFGYTPSDNRARFGLGYIRTFKKFSMAATAEAASDGSFAAGLNLAFSLGPDPRRGGMRMTSAPLASAGQLVALVYRDLNGNGRRDAGEPGEKDVQLAAGRVPIEGVTDASGQVLIDGLSPYRAILVGVDASSLPDPLVQPAGSGIVVTPRPGIAAQIELPLSATGEVDGTLVRAGGSGIEGVDLELVDIEGHVVGRTQSDFDGFFLFEAVPYGKFGVRIAKLAAEATGLQSQLRSDVVVGEATPSPHLGAVAAQPFAQADKVD
jgi:hypothetical protein